MSSNNFKTIFLDLDGVLHPSTVIQSINTSAFAYLNPASLQKLGLFKWNQLLENVLAECKVPVDVVIHSSWRKQSWATNSFLRTALGPLGHRFSGVTRNDLSREASIQDIVQRCGIEDYLILDDARDEFSDQSNLLVTNPLQGVSNLNTLNSVRNWFSREFQCGNEVVACK